METKANYMLIGLFTLAVIASAFGFIYWFSRSGDSQDRTPYAILFEGPVSGLRTGATVNFNGIRVGDVTELRLDTNDPRKVLAKVVVNSDTPVRADTRVTLEYQGLTGIAAVSMKGGSSGAPPIKAKEGEIPMLYADSGGVQDLMDAAREVMGKADSILGHVDGFVRNNEQPLTTIVTNVADFSKQLSGLGKRFDNILVQVEAFTGSPETKGALDEINAAAKSFRVLADNLDTRTSQLTRDVSQFTGPGLRELQSFASDGRKTLQELERTIRNLDKNPQRLIYGGGSGRVPDYQAR